jgi:hypothetical protein
MRVKSNNLKLNLMELLVDLLSVIFKIYSLMNRVFNRKNIKFLIQNNLIKIKRIINND